MKTDKNIGTELNEIAPVLASLKKPKSEDISAFYFSSVKENVLAKVRQNEIFAELESIAPTLSVLVKPQLGKVPANYFKTLPNILFETIQQTKKSAISTEKPNFFGQISIWIESVFALPQLQMILATVIAVFIITGVYSSFSTEAKNSQLLAEAKASLTQEDIQLYLLEHSYEVDESILENQAEQNIIHIQPVINADDVRAYMEEEKLSEENFENV